MKKNILLIFLAYFFLLCNCAKTQQWELLPSINDSATSDYRVYRAINFVSQDTGFLALTAEKPAFNVIGCIYKTENGGYNWRKVVTEDITIRNISVSGNMAYAVGIGENALYYSGQILISSNRGENWSRCTTIVSNTGFSNVVQVSGVVYVSCYDGKIYSSSNNGVSWNISYNSSSLFSSFDTNSSSILYLGGDSDLRKKVLGGNWELVSNHGIFSSQKCLSIDRQKNIIYICGRNYAGTGEAAISMSTDNGLNWHIDTLVNNRYGMVESIASNLYGECYAVGYVTNNEFSGRIWRKVNSSWQEDSCSDMGLKQIIAVGSFFYVIGENAVYKKNCGYLTYNHDPKINITLNLSQNYPNPFNPVTKIKYELPKNSKVTLKVFDLSGREVTTLVNQQQPAGTYEVAFDGTKLSSGTYFYRIQAGDYVATKKMMLIK